MVSFGQEESKSETRPTRTELWNDEQKKLFEQLFNNAMSGMESGVPSYPGQMYAGRTPEEQSYFDAISRAYSPENMSTRSDTINQVLSGKPAYEINPEITEQFYQQNIKPAYMEEWEEITKPQLRESYAGPGYWGSARAFAETEASKDLASTLASKRAELYYQDELARRQGLESAAGRRATLAGSPTDALSGATAALGTAGQYARSVEQERVTADLQRWLMGETVDGKRNQAYNPYIQLALAMMGLYPYAVTTEGESSSSGFSFGVSKLGGK